MKFRLEIESGNAAFADSPEIELARLLRLTADRLEFGDRAGALIDINGNRVGDWNLELPEVEDDDTD